MEYNIGLSSICDLYDLSMINAVGKWLKAGAEELIMLDSVLPEVLMGEIQNPNNNMSNMTKSIFLYSLLQEVGCKKLSPCLSGVSRPAADVYRLTAKWSPITLCMIQYNV